MLKNRSSEKEILDDLQISGPLVTRNLKELEMVNKWLGGYTASLEGIERLLEKHDSNSPVTVADFCCGGGDTLRVLHDWAGKKSKNLKLTGIDANGFIVNFAREYTPKHMGIEYNASDIFSDEVRAQQYDIIHCSLSCHHFDNEMLVKLFRQLKDQSRLGFVINDLHRHPVAWYSIKLLSHLVLTSPLAKNDGPVSVARAFKKEELEDLLKEAGIEKYKIEWKWAFRWLVEV